MGEHKFPKKQERQEKQIKIPSEVAMQLKIMEFDQAIARAEEQLATFKKQRAEFILNENLNLVRNQFSQKPLTQPGA